MRTIQSKFAFSWAVVLLFFSFIFIHSIGAEEVQDKVKGAIESAAEALKGAVDKIGNNLEDLQKYFDHYPWKGVIQDRTTSGAATLENLKLNHHERAVVVKPGERVDCSVICHLDRTDCSSLSIYRIAVGIKGEGAQTTICNYLGLLAGDSVEKFTLIAPADHGVYEVRFRPAEGLTEKEALKAWTDAQGQEPGASTTIGFIVVAS